MKKILFLLLFCLIKLNAYEYLIYFSPNAINIKYEFFKDVNGVLNVKYIRSDGSISNNSFITAFFEPLYYIKFNKSPLGNGYIHNDEFVNIWKNDLDLLNDLYLSKSLIPFLNYLYNNNSFSSTNYINYEDYQILYNGDGLAVESIVDGVWAGLYLDSQKSKSGALYDKNGSLIYYNGKEVTPVTSFLVWLQKFTNKVIIETFEEIQRSLVAGIIAAVVLVLAIVRLVLELLPSSITPRRRRYYGGGRGSLPDYGDGSQVAASVRARLAAKNRALKARAYDRSGVEQSLQNSILFDLENDR